MEGNPSVRPGEESKTFRFTKIFLVLTLLTLASCAEDTDAPLSSGFGSGENRLLSDAELRTDPDPEAPEENEHWVAWIKDNHVPIRSITSSYYHDLQFLKPLLKGKRLVQLGENSHGVAQYNLVKVRLVKFLHEEMGFDVIAFESGIFECFNGNEKKVELSPLDLMTSSINGLWHTNEVLGLFEYIKSTAETENPLTLAGFDILMPVASDITERPDLFRKVIAKVDSAYAREVYDLDTNFINKRGSYSQFKTFVGNNRTQLLENYRNIVSFIENHQTELASAFSHNPLIPSFARQMAHSTTRYIDRVYCDYTGDLFGHQAIRDLGMAENAEFLMDRAYPDKKIINWAHNFHVCHDSEQIEDATHDMVESMGSHLIEEHRDDMYTIGLYMYRGQAAFYHVNIYDVTEATTGSLESIFYHARKKYCYVDMLHEDKNDGNSWMFEIITAKNWGTMAQTMILRNQYDGILFVDTVTPIEYITYRPSMGKPEIQTRLWDQMTGE